MRSHVGHESSEATQLRAQLDALRAELDQAREKHQVDAEEFEATNEELRVAFAELELGKAESGLLNEALTAANYELKDKIEELARANGDLQNLMAATAIATVFLDRQLRITRYTPAATAIFPLVAGDVGRPLAHLRHRLDHAELEADITRALDQLCLVEREVAGTNGEWFLLRVLPCRTGDEVTGVVLTCVNITERKQAEERRQAQEAAERLHRARSEFLSRMSHELRTPLNAILGFGQVLELGSHTQEDTVAVGLILKAGRHLLSLVDEVLDLTQVEAGKLHLNFAAVDLGRIARECLHMTARLAETRQIVCEVESSERTLPTLWTDEQRLRQILLNLLTNAIKYNRPGGQVSIRCGHEGEDQCLISIRDTGFGITAVDLPRLFAPFERLHLDHGEIEGTGLGLAITRQMVEALGGSVGVESVPDQGSCFWIKLPLARAPLATVEEAAALPAKPQDATPPPAVTLLYIEDNASNLELLRTMVARRWPHWSFVSALDAATGLEQARQHHPDLVLLDLQLPDHSGDWVLGELRRDPRTASVPVLVLSADATSARREKLRDAGAEAFLTKPFVIDDLIQAMGALLRQRRNAL